MEVQITDGKFLHISLQVKHSEVLEYHSEGTCIYKFTNKYNGATVLIQKM